MDIFSAPFPTAAASRVMALLTITNKPRPISQKQCHRSRFPRECRRARREPKGSPKGPPTTAQTLSRNLVRCLTILGHILAPKMTLKMSPKSSRNIHKLWSRFINMFYHFFQRDRFQHLGKSLKSIVNTNRIARWHFCAYVVSV